MSSREIRLSVTSYVVLGTIDLIGPSSPYRLKKLVDQSVADFHPVPHTTLYEEPARLAAAGYLEETQEQGGRRRKSYALTEKGARALKQWLSDPAAEPTELRSPALLKVFFGADPEPLARAQMEHHERLIEFFETVRAERGDGMRPAPRRLLDVGIEFHTFFARTWRRLGQR
jgi:DNA-binding PadR family transcriptional regulator